ncbi:MAG: hypothetical protein NVS3B20_27560 [Polyangiales bacterium]
MDKNRTESTPHLRGVEAMTSKSKTQIRKAAGRSLEWAGVHSGTSHATARLYEANPDAVKDPRKRADLDALYARLAKEAAHAA